VRIWTAGLALVWLTATVAVAAQGHRGAPPGQIDKPPKAPSEPAPSPDPAAPGAADPSPGLPDTTLPPVTARTFGVWLDDATLAPGGSVWVTAGVTRWRTPAAHGVDAPSIAIAAGLTPRAQLSLSVPYSRLATDDATYPSGIGDVYAGVKILLIDPVRSRIGLSTSPTLEVLNGSGAPRRSGLVLPLSIEAGRGPVRVYGSTGFFTRGAVFASGAVEFHAAPRLSVTGSLSRSWTTSDQSATADLGLAPARTDASGTAVAFLGPSAAAFLSVSRTISRLEFDSTQYGISAGIAFVLTPPADIPIRPPR
jgi:hypothetical protein